MKMNIKLVLPALLALPMAAALDVQASQVFGEVWRDTIVAASDQARIVYYRPASNEDTKPAHIYVDGEFQTALLPNGFSDFCVTPGQHSLGSYVGDAPHYSGKELQPWRDTLKAGVTYYVRANLDASGRPLVIKPEIALAEMVGLKKQKHVLSRASAVVVCHGSSQQTYENYSFSSDLLFRFKGYGINDIQEEGRKALVDFAQMIRARNMLQKNIIVTGYTDPLGDEQSNQLLGQRRADTVKQMLVNNGVSINKVMSRSMGESQVNKQCYGGRTEKIQCFSSERRVVISIED